MKELKQKLAGILIVVLIFGTTPVYPAFADETTPPATAESQLPAADTSGSSGASLPAPTTVVTGDAVASTDVENSVNLNIVQTTDQTTDPTSDQTSATDSTQSGGGGGTGSTQETDPPFSVEFTADNNSKVQNDSATAADTGANVANNNGSDASIDTGNAYAEANVLNVLNTNIFNSNGFFFLLNSFLGNIGNIDVRGMSAANDSLLSCGTLCNGVPTSLSTVVSSDNTASITNDVVVRSSTGGNNASGNAGGTSIHTGDALAAANVVNVANTNIVNSNYMLLVFNNFGDWNGDLIFPNADFFASRFFGNPSIATPTSSVAPDSEATQSVSVGNTNEALVENSATTTADTGDNETSGNGSGTIQTGNAVSQTTVHNTVNANFFNSDSFVVLFKVYGNWGGNVYNAPDNISWAETPGGVSLFSTGGGEGEQSSTTPPASGENSGSFGTGGASSSLSVSSNNRASIENQVKVFALTGSNRANGNSRAEVSSGNAYASTNIVNIANTNIIGRNWVLAIVNIFGNWGGNVSFGQPDLWVGSSIDEKGGAFPNSQPVYHFTVANKGDANATNVKLKTHLNKPFLSFNHQDSGDTLWNLGTIPAGTSIEVAYTADVTSRSRMPWGQNEVVTDVTVSSYETDGNTSDNTDVITLAINNPYRPPKPDYTSDPVLTISKTVVGSTSLYQRETASYKIVIDNRGGPAYHSVLTDTLKNQGGEVVSEEKWDLGEIQPNEEITITYDTPISASTSPGTYTNYAILNTIGRHPSLDPFLGHYVDSNIASTSITILQLPDSDLFTGGDADFKATTESILATTTPSDSSASTTVTIFGTVEKEIRRIWGTHFPSLDGAAFSDGTLIFPFSSSPPPSLRQPGFAAAFGARSTTEDMQMYLMLLIAAFFIQRLYHRRGWFQGRFADFL